MIDSSILLLAKEALEQSLKKKKNDLKQKKDTLRTTEKTIEDFFSSWQYKNHLVYLSDIEKYKQDIKIYDDDINKIELKIKKVHDFLKSVCEHYWVHVLGEDDERECKYCGIYESEL